MAFSPRHRSRERGTGTGERFKTAVSRAYAAVRLRLPSRGVALRVISPLRVGRHMAGGLRGAEGRERTENGLIIFRFMYKCFWRSGRPVASLSRGEDIYRKVSRN